MATQRNLTAGPSKFDLMASLFTGKRVIFTIEGLGEQEALVSLVEAEDGSFESWNIQGDLTQMGRLQFKGFFSTRHRQGNIEADFPEEQAQERKPKNGDRAYTRYHGRRFEGIIVHVDEFGRGALEPADPNTDWGYHKGANCIIGNEHRPFRGLFFGYDEPVVWDTEAGMWYTPADHD